MLLKLILLVEQTSYHQINCRLNTFKLQAIIMTHNDDSVIIFRSKYR